MRTQFYVSVAIAALMLPGAAFAQSSGSIDFEDGPDIVVTGTTERDVGGIEIPDSPKAKVVVNSELIQRQRPGQSVNEIINLVPGVSFTNNDPWGSSGGNFTIRGFNSDRISQTFDGLPLNDSGNYAIYSSQQVDPELVDRINVNLGSTDVDSPTAAAVGGTVNINTIVPSDEMGALLSASYGNILADGAGDRPYHRVFGMIQTGDLTGAGTTAFISASSAYNVASFANYGKVSKDQYNAKIYQRIGNNGDFISLAGHYNVSRNNFGGSPLSATTFDGDIDKSERFYEIAGGYPCNVSLTGVVNSCGTSFERRYNPSNTGNIRLNSRFTLADGLIFSLDGGYQHVKANGGGTTSAYEGFFNRAGQAFTGFFGGSGYYGRDLNGDGNLGTDVNGDGIIQDVRVGDVTTVESDRMTVVQPSQTQTRRWVAIANLAYDINESHRVRLSYSFDRARHRQTGETGALYVNGEPFDVFPVNDPLTDEDGNVLQKRDRLSYATLHQVAGEYRGEFLEDRLTVLLGLRVPFFTRDLEQNCFTTSTTGFVECIAGGAGAAAYGASNPYVIQDDGTPTGAAPPMERTYNYDKFLPNVGAVFKITPDISLAGSYAKNISVPGTDTLYNSLYVPEENPAAQPVAETSDSYDVSLRYQTGIVQAGVTGWYSTYNDRIVSAYNIECDCSVDTNLGQVKKYGVDASVSIQPIPQLLLYAFGSYIKSEIQDDVITATGVLDTAGNRERGAPEYLWGGRAQGTLGPVDLGAQIKRTGSRFLNDINTFEFKGYTVVDLDVRFSLADYGLEKTFVQFNVSNLFDEFYAGSFGGGLTTAPGSTFVNFGSPRAISGSLVVAF